MKNIILLMIMGLSLAGCRSDIRPNHQEVNSVYFWKTEFWPDIDECQFLKQHDVRRVYLRMFDVTEDCLAEEAEERAVPNASVRIERSALLDDYVGQLEYVPVVFVTLPALRAMQGNEGALARNITTRVRNMCEYHELPNVHELQLDCDWTTSTEASFFRLCDSVRHQIKELRLPWCLSSTIRLHQLARKAPPVDRGVLMVYNTGSFNDPDEENSIISLQNVKPYLRHLEQYPLHLDVAYPTYSWQLLFRHREFKGLMQGVNLGDSTLFERLSPNVYCAKQDVPYHSGVIMKGDVVREESSEFPAIQTVKQLIEQRLVGREHSNILYHLDSKNLSNYNSDEINQLYSVFH